MAIKLKVIFSFDCPMFVERLEFNADSGWEFSAAFYELRWAYAFGRHGVVPPTGGPGAQIARTTIALHSQAFGG